MKKILATTILMLVLSMSTAVSVSADSQTIETYEYEKEPLEMILSGDISDDSIESNQYQVLKQKRDNYKASNDGQSRPTFKGIWGYLDDNQTQGYVGGYLGRRGRFGVLKGVWNTTDGSAKGGIAGIMKRGFFNGKIFTEEGRSRIIGLYRVDRENQTFHMKWMTKNKQGWAHCQIKLD